MRELKPSAITYFVEQEDRYFVSVFPSLAGGIVTVLCGDDGGTDIKVVHDCMICSRDSDESCPFVKEAMRLYMIHKHKRFTSYTFFQRLVVIDPEWLQIAVPEFRREDVSHEKQSAATHS